MAYKPATGVLLALALMVAVPAQAAPAVIWEGLALGMSVPEAKFSHPEMMALPTPVPRAGFARYVMQGPSIGSCLSNVDVNFLGGRLASVEVHALTDTIPAMSGSVPRNGAVRSGRNMASRCSISGRP